MEAAAQHSKQNMVQAKAKLAQRYTALQHTSLTLPE